MQHIPWHTHHNLCSCYKKILCRTCLFNMDTLGPIIKCPDYQGVCMDILGSLDTIWDHSVDYTGVLIFQVSWFHCILSLAHKSRGQTVWPRETTSIDSTRYILRTHIYSPILSMLPIPL